MTVRRRRIGDILELRRKPVTIEPDEQYRRIGIYSWGKGFLHRPAVPGSEMGSLRYFTFPDRALVLSNIQAWEAAIAVSGPAEHDHVASNRFLPYVARDEDEISVDYLLHYFLSDDGLAALRRASPGTQVRNRTLGQRLFEEIEVPLPSATEQEKISTRLGAIAAISKEGHAKRFSSRHSPGQILPSLLELPFRDAIPQNTSLSSLCRNVLRVIHPSDGRQGAREFVGLEHIESHTGRRVGSRTLAEEKGRKLLFLPGEITFGYLRPYLNKVWLADRVGLCSVEQYVLAPVDSIDPELLAHLLRSAIVLTRAVEETHSLQLPRLRLDKLMTIQVPDIRNLQDSTTLKARLFEIADRTALLAESTRKAKLLLGSILPAARNEVFSALQ